MKEFSYKARDMRGALIQGSLRCEDANTARIKLTEQNLIPISISSSGPDFLIKIQQAMKAKVKLEELVLFTKQFFTLFKAGMGMETVLATLSRQVQNLTMKEALETIRNDIQQGMGLAKAFSKHPLVFDELYINMLASGEEAGILEETLSQLGDLLEKDASMKKGIKSALLYPKIVIGVLIMASVVLLTVVIPKFEQFFSRFGAELPLPTKIMVWMSDFMTDYFFIMVGLFLTLRYFYRRYYATPKGKLFIDKNFFKVPVFGPLALKVCNARFANILASLYQSGLPMTKALAITGETIGNAAFMRDVRILQSEVERGAGIAVSMRHLTFFSDIIIEATNIGEKTGSLDSMLKSIGGHYEMEINHTVKNLTTLLEPMMLVVIFGMVTLFALAIFMPIWGMSQAALKKH